MKKVSLIIVIIVIISSLFILSGCTSSVSETENRFKILTEETPNHNDYYAILYDTKTKVMYLQFDGYKCGGITVLLDTEGKPLLYEGE